MLHHALSNSLRLIAVSCALLGSLTSAATWQLPIDVEQATEVVDFDAAAVQVIADPAGGAPAYQAVPVRGKGRQATFTTRHTIQPPVVIEADVRMPTDVSTLTRGFSRASGTLTFEPADAESENPVDASVTVNRARFRDDYSYQVGAALGKDSTSFQLKPLYTLGSISPLMDENVRLILERRVDRIPIAHERVHRLRMEVRRDGMRMYVNGRFVQAYPDAPQAGRVTAKIVDDAMLLNLRITPLPEHDPSFVPVPLDDLCNAAGPFDTPPGLAAERGATSEIEGVPFVRSGNDAFDHVDLEPSVYMHRMGNFRVGDARETVYPPEMMDVTRFTLRVPPRTYRRAWVLAAADDEPHSTPVLTVRYYRPRTPWNVDAQTRVPTFEATSVPEHARRLAGDGGKALWLIPIDLDAGALAVEPMGCLELTKEIYPYRGYPDPAYYNAYPGGLPSAVHVFGLTLEEAPIWARGTGAQNANLYTDPEKPVWRVLIRNLDDAAQTSDVAVTVTDPYGQVNTYTKRVQLAAGAPEQELTFEPKVSVYGLHTVQTTVSVGDFRQSREGTFLRLPPDDRKATGANSPWGLWCWMGTHQTNPSPEDNLRILKALGAVNSFQFDDRPSRAEPPVSLYELRRQYGVNVMHHRLVSRQMPDWAQQDPYDQAAFDAYAEEKGLEAAQMLKEHPDLQFVNLFAENSISLRLTHGMSPWAMGQPYFEYDAREARNIRAHWLTAKAIQQGVRKHAPSLKILFGHGAGNFAQPFFRLEDWNDDLFDGFGMDLPQFERMPERQPRATEPSLLYFLYHQLKERGLVGRKLVVHLESYFPPDGPLALTQEQQAQSVVRTAALSMALGTTHFLRTWSLHSSGDGWGSSHYGNAGMIGRWPEFNPKPAAAAFATMTRVLDLARFDGYLDVGSRSAYCLRFKDTDRLVYVAWTFHGSRPLHLTVDRGAAVTRYDEHGNAFPVELENGAATITLSPTPQWLVVRSGAITAASVGEPTYAAAPRPVHAVLDDFESSAWTYDPAEYTRFQNNHWDMPRAAGTMAYERVRDDARNSTVLRVQLTNADQSKPMVGFYGVFAPPRPIAIPGKAKALGLWVNGRSAWNRVIYEVTDARGEVWLSCGTKDAWNCDDIHSWSSVAHDGWRYLSFPLPATAPGDNFREADTTWWGSNAEGIVDLPLTLTRVIVEMRPQMVYVNDMLPVPDYTLELDDLTVEYESESDATDAPVKLQAAARDALLEGELLPLPNPLVTLRQTGVGAAPRIARVYPPDDFNNGRRLFLDVEPVEGAVRYLGYVSVYPDGRGAQPLSINQESKHNWARRLTRPEMLFFDGLIPDRPMYLFVTWIDAAGNESKPSEVREVVLKDEFPFD